MKVKKRHTAVSVALNIPSSVPQCTEDAMLNAAETKVGNFSDFYWCSKRYSFSCFLYLYTTLHFFSLFLKFSIVKKRILESSEYKFSN